MQAKLRELTTVDGEPLASVLPVPAAFHVSLRALIGPADGQGEESFDFDVCSPAWLDDRLNYEAILSGRFQLISRRFDPDQIETFVRERIAQATGRDWPTVAGKLARWSQWEFEDYRER
jgi:hypothetical protein